MNAPAKVNLALTVHPPDGTGFHPLDSVVQTVSLTDTVEVREAATDSLVVTGAALSDGPDNLVAIALAELRRRAPEVPPLAVTLHKRIPTEAGLGGGSADAAALLRVAGRWASGVDLVAVAAEVGSDVAALVLGGTVHMTGRGDRVTPLPAVTTPRWLLTVPPFGVPTPAAYRAWDDLGGPAGDPKDWPATTAAIGRPVANDLEPAAVATEPGLGEWLVALGALAGRPAMVSGSGSACFVEVDEPLAEDARRHPLLATARLVADVGPVGQDPAPK